MVHVNSDALKMEKTEEKKKKVMAPEMGQTFLWNGVPVRITAINLLKRRFTVTILDGPELMVDTHRRVRETSAETSKRTRKEREARKL